MVMQIPDMSNLSPTDSKILSVLTRELTVMDASTISGVPYEYCKKRIILLKKKGLLTTIQTGSQYLYRTVRLPETEDYYRLAETRSSTALLYEFQFNGEYGTFNKHIGALSAERKNIQSADVDLLAVVYRILSALKNRAYKKSLGQTAQWPDENRMRSYLLERIALAKKELALAEELFAARGLWSGSPKVCEQISEGPPSSNVITAYENLGKMF